MPAKKIIAATRRSPLALRQTRMVIDYLSARFQDCTFELREIVTSGDRRRDWSLEKEGGKGLFTGELEGALRRGEADIAVHSTKDLPTEPTPGLALAGFLPRDDARDVLVLRKGITSPAVLATNSPRRRAQGRLLFPGAEWKEIRGNVETRLGKIAGGFADGTFLAMAGLNRLGISSHPGLSFSPVPANQMVPAVGQGAVAVQSRSADVEIYSPVLDEPARFAVDIERKFLELLGGGCHAAFAGHFADGVLHVYHEKCGYRQFPLSEGPKAMEEVEAVVRELNA